MSYYLGVHLYSWRSFKILLKIENTLIKILIIIQVTLPLFHSSVTNEI